MPAHNSSSPPEEEISPERKIIVKKERPLVRMLVISVSVIIATVVLLFFLGFAMHYMGIKPPSFDKEVINNKWEQLNKPGPAASPEAVAPSLTTTAAPSPSSSPEVAPSAVPSFTEGTDPAKAQEALTAGREAGKTFAKHKEYLTYFWQGFNEGAAGR